MMQRFPRRPPPDFIYNPPQEDLVVLHEDDDLLVLSKPSGLLTVPGRRPEHRDSLESRVQAQYPKARIVHRLDMDTSGVIVMAMNAEAHRHVGLQFERRKTEKEYVARIWDTPAEDSGLIDLPLRCDWPNRPLQMVDLSRGKEAQTYWSVLSREEGTSRVSLKPVTGRTHQLRVHMAEIGHPILGDDFYAHKDAYQSAERLCLHARMLGLHHPRDGQFLYFESPLPF